MADARNITGVYAIWLTADEAAVSWLDAEFVPRASAAPAVVGVERLSDELGDGTLLLAWLGGDVDGAAELDGLRGELEARFGDVDPDSGLYRRRNLVGDGGMANGVLAIRLRVRPGAEQDARDWLDGEHSVRQLTVAGSVNFQGFERVGAVQPFLNIWGVDDLAIIDSEAWTSLRSTPWRDRFWTEVVGTTPGRYLRTRNPLAVA